MLFNSVGFFLFLAVVFALYWMVPSGRAHLRNWVLILGSAFFYLLIDPRFLPLLVLNAVVNFGLAHGVAHGRTERLKALAFWSAMVFNLGLLFYFKYLGFFLAGVSDLLQAIGLEPHPRSLGVVLPLGISFYTLQMLGYIIDVDREEVEPSRDPLGFLAYVLFFPKILAGPIEPARRFLPQVARAPAFDRVLAADGTRQILWGLFAKVVIADRCGVLVDHIFAHHQQSTGSTLLLGAFLYLFQIYADFSGYSNMAIGVSKLLGIRLQPNFSTPLFATNISDFWRRWHISLTQWMMDYVFTPLSFIWREAGRMGMILAILVTFFLVGLWHGAKWTSIIFGLLQGVMFIPLMLTGGMDKRRPLAAGSAVPRAGDLLRMAGMFTFMLFAFVIARADDMVQAAEIFRGIASSSLFAPARFMPKGLLAAILFFVAAEWLQRGREHALQLEHTRWPMALRYTAYYGLLLLVFWYGGKENEFIYRQF